jgi:uncharacterized protein YndB with AHSA1/START domain
MAGELRTSVDVDAGPELVWEVLTDVPAYPQWAPVLTGAEGTFAAGGQVWLSFPPGNPLLRTRARARVLEVTPYQRLRFGLRLARLGTPGLLDTDHRMTIVERDGGVRLWLEIRFRGLLLPVLTRSLNRDRAPAFGPVPENLKAQIERLQATRSD